MTKVSIIKAKDYSNIEKDIEKAVDLIGGMSKFIKKGDKVLIKPNLLTKRPASTGTTTHPKMIEGLIKLIRKEKGVVYVGDSPAGSTTAEKVCESNGIKEVCDKYKVDIVDLKTPIVKRNEKNKVLRAFKIAKEIYKFDKIINVPKLKTHMLCGMTLAVKNMYGVVPRIQKANYHRMFPDSNKFSEMIIDLHNIVKPTLSIMDGVIGMEGQGPSAGNPRNFGLILASESSFALDAVVGEIFGKSKTIQTVYLAKKRGIKESDINNVSVMGESIDSVKVNDLKLPFFNAAKIISSFPGFLKNLLVPKPFTKYKKCTSCGECASICPVNAIKMTNGKPVYNYSKCFRCFSCHEICPESAICLKTFR